MVGSLGNGCSAEALGPCEGEGRWVVTSSNKLLQVSWGRRPQLIDSASTGGPDKARPPASEGPMQVAAPAFQRGCWSRKVPRGCGRRSCGKSGNPVAVSSSIAAWGRWGALANGQSGAEVVREVLNGRQLAAIPAATMSLESTLRPCWKCPMREWVVQADGAQWAAGRSRHRKLQGNNSQQRQSANRFWRTQVSDKS